MSQLLNITRQQILDDPELTAADREEMLKFHGAVAEAVEALSEALEDMPTPIAMVVVTEVGRKIMRKLKDEVRENKALGFGPHGEGCDCGFKDKDFIKA